MKSVLPLIGWGVLWLFIAAPALRADVVEMQNGDRYSGKVLSVSADAVMLNSEMLGKIAISRKSVATLSFGTNSVLPKAAGTSMVTNLPALPAMAPKAPESTNLDLTAAIRQLGANTNFIGQVRQQLLTGSPEAAGKYDEMVNGLLTGQLNLADVRQEAQSSANQLRALKRELGPEADDTLDAYLKVLDDFVKETANEPAPASKSP